MGTSPPRKREEEVGESSMNPNILDIEIARPYSPKDPKIMAIAKEAPNEAKLLIASAKGCNINILSLLSEGADVHTCDHNGPDAPLRYACANGHPTTVMLLLEKGSNPRIKGGLALKLATIAGSSETLEVLMSRGIKYSIDKTVPYEYSYSRTTYRMSKYIIGIIKRTRE